MREDGRWSTGWLKEVPNWIDWSVVGRESTGKLKFDPKHKEWFEMGGKEDGKSFFPNWGVWEKEEIGHLMVISVLENVFSEC